MYLRFIGRTGEETRFHRVITGQHEMLQKTNTYQSAYAYAVFFLQGYKTVPKMQI